MTKHILAVIVLFVLLLTSCGSSDETCPDGSAVPCLCTKEYEPVCGCNNKTYGNSCTATCAGVTDFTEGECP